MQTPFRSQILVVGGTGLAGTLADAFLLDIGDDEVTRFDLAALPAARSEMLAVALDDDRVLLTGGFDAAGAPRAETWIFDRVPAGFASPRPPEPFCGLPRPIVFEEDVAHIVGTTAAGFSELRATGCQSASTSAGAETTFLLHLEEPRHIRFDLEVETGLDNVRAGALWLVVDACGPNRAEIGCSIADTTTSLDATLPAGDTLLVVEAEATAAGTNVARGSSFELFVRDVGAAGSCLPDPFDPDDDEPAAARPLSPPPDVVRTLEGSGQLCPGDIDHVFIEHAGGDFNIDVGGVRNSDALVIPCDLDEPASIAEGRPVLTPRTAEAAPFTRFTDYAAGYYVVRLAPFVSEVPEAFVHASWRLSYLADCVLDAGDSLFAGLDDENDHAARTVAHHAEQITLSFCNPEDVDVVVIELPPGDVSIVFGETMPFRVVALADDGAILGDVEEAVITADFSSQTAELAAADRPARLAAVIGPSSVVEEDVHIAAYVLGGAGDTCADPLALPSDSGELDVDTTLFRPDVNAFDLSPLCTGWESRGPDGFYAFELGAGDTITIDAVGVDDGLSIPDVAVYIFDACPPAAGDCVAGVDDGTFAIAEHLEFTNPGPARPFFLAVDSDFGEGFRVELTWTIERN